MRPSDSTFFEIMYVVDLLPATMRRVAHEQVAALLKCYSTATNDETANALMFAFWRMATAPHVNAEEARAVQLRVVLAVEGEVEIADARGGNGARRRVRMTGLQLVERRREEGLRGDNAYDRVAASNRRPWVGANDRSVVAATCLACHEEFTWLVPTWAADRALADVRLELAC